MARDADLDALKERVLIARRLADQDEAILNGGLFEMMTLEQQKALLRKSIAQLRAAASLMDAAIAIFLETHATLGDPVAEPRPTLRVVDGEPAA